MKSEIFGTSMQRPVFFNADDERDFDAAFIASLNSTHDSETNLDAAQKRLGTNPNRGHICLDCALPLKISPRGQERECDCQHYEITEAAWWDSVDAGILLVAFIALICLCASAAFWF